MSLEALITPQVLHWARKNAGFSIDDVVEKLDQKRVTSEVILNWETGEKKPTYTQFEKLAKYYKRPLALFFLPEPPEEETLEEKFRSLPNQYIHNLPPKIRFLTRKAKVRQLNLAELYDGQPPKELDQLKELKKTSNDTRHYDIKQLARGTRKLIDISSEDQAKWKNIDDALKNWRERLTNLGIWVFKDSFGEEAKKYDGFYLADEHFPAIYLNNNQSKSRQVFTLFHELGHFLLSKGGICFRDNLEQRLDGNFREEEIFCNAFASEFLVPDDELYLTQMLSDQDIEKYAKQYKVSREVILRKCKDKGFIDWREYDQKVEIWRDLYLTKTKKKDRSSGGGNPYFTKKAYLGDRYFDLVFSKYYRQHISESQLADYLEIKIGSLPMLEAAVYQGGNQ